MRRARAAAPRGRRRRQLGTEHHLQFGAAAAQAAAMHVIGGLAPAAVRGCEMLLHNVSRPVEQHLRGSERGCERL